MSELSNPIMTKEEFRQMVVELATPVDFDQLIKDGVLEEDGVWYKLRDLKNLPKHASRKVKTIEQGPKGVRVRFYPVTKATLNLLHKIQG